MNEIKKEAYEFDKTMLSNHLNTTNNIQEYQQFHNKSAVIDEHLQTDEKEDKPYPQQFLASQIKREIDNDYIVTEILGNDDETSSLPEEPFIPNETGHNDLVTNEDNTCLQQFLASDVTIVKNEINSCNNDSAEQASSTSSYITIYECNLCKMDFDVQTNFINHMLTHDNSNKTNLNNISSLKCPICSKIYLTSNILTDHLKTHTDVRKFKCTTCNKLYGRKPHLNSHLKMHIESKNFKCDICNKTFQNKNTLNLHLKTHTCIDGFKCTICNKVFGRKSHLNSHLKIHTGTDEYKCDICNKTYTQKSSLHLHLKTHNDVKEFTCDICDKSFARRDYLNSHLKSHTSVKEYVCDICNTLFRHKISLLSHMRVHTDVKD